MVIRYLSMGSACLLAGTMVSVVAHAQQAPQTSAAQPAQTQAEGELLTEIVVTASRRSENLEEVPIAVTALSDKTRELLGVESVQDMTDFTPSLVYSNNVDRMTLRGIGRLTNNAGTEPSIATYIDGFYLTSNVQVGLSDLFTERVDILRGPEGTLYGRNAIGGAITTFSRRPSDDWSGEVRATLANYGRQVDEATFSGPIAGGWKFRVTGDYINQDRGYYKNFGPAGSEGGTQHDHHIDTQLQGAVGPVDVWLKFFTYQLNFDDRLALDRAPYDTTVFFPPNSLVPNPTFGYTVPNPSVANPRAINTDQRATDNWYGADLVTGHLTWHTGPLDVNYIGGYYHYALTLLQDTDNSSNVSYVAPSPPAFPNTTVYSQTIFNYQEFHHYYSNELNLTSTLSGPFSWIAGIFQYDENLYEPFSISVPLQTQLLAPVATIGGTPFVSPGAAPNPYGNIILETGRLHVQSVAAFGQADYKFGDWKATAGLRYNRDEKLGVATQRFITWDPRPFTSGGTTGVPFALDVTPIVTGFPASPAVMDVFQTTRGASGTAQLSWTPMHDSLVYAKYDRGFKAGSLNLGQVSLTPNTTIVKPEKLDAFEVGAKQQLFDQKLQLNADVFYYNYEDAQVPLQVPGTGTQFVTQFVNIAKSRTIGFELESIWQATSQLTFLANYSYLDAKIRDSLCFQDPLDPTASQPGDKPCPGGKPGSQSPVDSHLPASPPHKIYADIVYRFDFTPGSLSASVNNSYRSADYSFILSRPYYRTPSYDVLGARLTWSDLDDRYDLIAYIANATNKLAAENVTATANAVGSFDKAFSYLPPRTYGVEVQYRFGQTHK
jgi:iron complex outermembrane receptor protein